jgi:hypothetical protein
VLALALGVIVGLVFYARVPQAGTSPEEVPTALPADSCTVSDDSTRTTVAGPDPRSVCLQFRDLYGLALDAPAAQAMGDLQLRCSYRNSAGNLVNVEVARTESGPAQTALAICRDLATNPAWQVVQ